MQDSSRLRDSVYRRTRVRYGALLAERKLERGRLEEACADWHRVLDDYPHVQSGRCDDRIREMLSAIRPHQGNPAARLLHQRARDVVRHRT